MGTADIVFGAIIALIGILYWMLTGKGGENLADQIKKAAEEVEDVVEVMEDFAKETPAELQAKLEKMTKVQIEEHGREHGIELDKRKTKANMIKDFMGHVNHK